MRVGVFSDALGVMVFQFLKALGKGARGYVSAAVLSCGVLAAAVPVKALAQATPVYVPAIRVDTGPLLSPSDALASPSFASFTTGAPPPRSDRVKALAKAFKPDLSGVDEVHNYLRTSIEIVPQFGLKQGATGVALNRKGTPFDVSMLMVELVREMGLEARYQIGVASLTQAEVRGWLGTDDAKLVCQMLRDGGFPATVNASTDCASLSGGATAVEVLHVWVEVRQGAGTWYAFDPSIRTAAVVAPPSLPTMMALDMTGLAAAGGTVGTDQATNPNETQIRDKLVAGSTALNTALTADPDRAQISTRTLLGLPEPDAVYIHQQRLSSLPGRTALTGRPSAWTEMPAELRTRLRVTVVRNGTTPTSLIDWLGDGTAIGEDGLLTLDLQASGGQYETSAVEELRTYDGALLAQAPAVNVTNRTGMSQTVTLQIDHPYAALSGGLHDRTVQRRLALDMPVAISIGMGSTSFESVTEQEKKNASYLQKNKAVYPYFGRNFSIS